MGCGWATPLSPLPSCHNSWQLLQSFEDIPLCSILQQIQEKHDLQAVKKVRASVPRRSAALGGGYLGPSHRCPNPFQVMRRPALFANLFGVLALFQSGRLVKVKALGGRDYVDWLGSAGVTVTHPARTLYPFVGTRTQRH